MKNHLFPSTDSNNLYKYYTIKGKEDFLDDHGVPRVESADHELLAAKAIQNKKPKHFNSTNNYYRYYIKIHPSGTVYNPIKYYKINDHDSHKLVNNVCKNGWVFKEVNKIVFDKYIQFLITHNTLWLKEVERDINT